jgi:hypothetical protein
MGWLTATMVAAVMRLAALYRSGPAYQAFRLARMADGRTALSQHRRRAPVKSRSRRRVGAFTVISVLAIAAISAGAITALTMEGGGSDPAGLAVGLSISSQSGHLLVQEQQRSALLTRAVQTLNVASKPGLVAQPSNGSNGGGAGGGGGGGTPAPAQPPPSPHTNESLGYNLLPSYGFSQKTQWSCLYNLWMHESGWNQYAANASGAYGIPQALPGSKMATAGPDWQSNPTTQIKWGLGYIKGDYGTPCGAWAHEEAYGWY